MALLKWNDKYSVNVAEIDKQHSQLVDLINQIHDAMKSGKTSIELSAIFGKLFKYTREHFTLEEKLMAKAGYKDLQSHKKEHNHFTGLIKEYEDEFKEGRSTASIKTMKFLMDWVTKHIMSVDKKYSEFLNNAGIK